MVANNLTIIIRIKKWLRRLLRTVLIVAITLLAIRAYDSQKGTPLELWHKIIPHELSVKQINQANWDSYLQAEDAVFTEVKREVTDKLPANNQSPLNRYWAYSKNYSANFAQDWNRSFLLKPDGKPKGAVVLLHGLTDSPYSLRHIAEHYQKQGFVAVAIRMPAHGTVPAALSDVHWQAWFAATHLAVREARQYISKDQPLHMVGYSNGAALAVMYVLESIDNPKLAQVDQLILISPMIGVTSFARFAGLAGLPAIFPAFAKAAWVNIIPEYNPFKYNSFPVNGAKQSYKLTSTLQQQLLERTQVPEKLAKLEAQFPPVLTFQSVVDNTVDSKSVVSALYDLLPNQGNELVLFDVNKTVYFNPLLNHRAYNAMNDLLSTLPKNYQTTVIGNRSATSSETAAYVTKANSNSTDIIPLTINYPANLYSLSHIALPFPDNDSLYGANPAELNEFGISLGTVNIKGERQALVTSLDNLLRVSSNPFFDLMMEKIDNKIDQSLHKKKTGN